MKHQLYTFINVSGLALGIACFTLLYLMVRHELGYDKSFRDSHRTFRVAEHIYKDGSGEDFATTPFTIAPKLEEELPDRVIKTARVFNYLEPRFDIAYRDRQFREKGFCLADSSFFEIFDYEFALGDPLTALDTPNRVVITHAVALKYFGTADALGKKLVWQVSDTLTVSGVLKPQLPNSHLNFSLFASLSTLYGSEISRYMNSWRWNSAWTYLKLDKASSEQIVESRLVEMVDKYYDDNFKRFVTFDLQPLEEIYLTSSLRHEITSNGDLNYVYIFMGIAALILIIACINFMNLSTARASLRAKEIGVRKAIGAHKSELVRQFLFESFFLSLFAILLSFSLIEILAPHINKLSGNRLAGVSSTEVILGVIITGILLGSVSGAYPAYYLSSLRAADIFSGSFRWGYRSKKFRSALVVIQFVISVFMLVSTMVSHDQFQFLKNSKLGFDKEQVIVLPVSMTRVAREYDFFKNDLLKYEEIVSVTGMQDILGQSNPTYSFFSENAQDEDYTLMQGLAVRPDFLKTFNIKLIAGRDFKSDYPYPIELLSTYRISLDSTESYVLPPITSDDEMRAVIINEAALAHLGYENADSALFKRLALNKSTNLRLPEDEIIVGVTENFHFAPLRKPMSPFVFFLTPPRMKKFYTKYVAVKLRENQVEEGIQIVEKVWNKYAPDQQAEYMFLEDSLNKLYTREKTLGQLSAYFAYITILIACMGLFGLSSFVVERRRKEIGIRKALGAPNTEIIFVLNKSFLQLVCISILIGWAASYYILKQWLGSFAYHIEPEPYNFLLAGLIVLNVTILILGIHTFRAVRSNPIDAINKDN